MQDIAFIKDYTSLVKLDDSFVKCYLICLRTIEVVFWVLPGQGCMLSSCANAGVHNVILAVLSLPVAVNYLAGCCPKRLWTPQNETSIRCYSSLCRVEVQTQASSTRSFQLVFHSRASRARGSFTTVIRRELGYSQRWLSGNWADVIRATLPRAHQRFQTFFTAATVLA